MKKVLVPTALAICLATGLIAAEDKHLSDTAATEAAATATDKLANEKATTKATTTVTDEHHAPAKVVKTSKKGTHHHHSKVDVKLANELTDKLNAMPCPVVPATEVAAVPAA